MHSDGKYISDKSVPVQLLAFSFSSRFPYVQIIPVQIRNNRILPTILNIFIFKSLMQVKCQIRTLPEIYCISKNPILQVSVMSIFFFSS